MKNKGEKSVLRGIIFAFIIFILPRGWVNPIEMFLATPLKLLKPSEEKTYSQRAKNRIKQLELEILTLKSELEALRHENQTLTKKLKEIAEFTEILPTALRLSEFYSLIVAEVILAQDASSWRQSILINRGSSSGVAQGMPVIVGKYLVGKVIEVGPYTSRVQLLTDPAFRLKGMVLPVESSAEKFSQSVALEKTPAQIGIGVIQGHSKEMSQMKWVSREIPVKTGWKVFSAQDSKGDFPKGLIIGEVTKIMEEGHLLRLMIKPAVDATNLTYVVILKRISKTSK